MKDGIARSPLFYVGDKFKLIPEIRSHFPQRIDRFVEPFVGGGSVMLNVPAKRYVLNDLDSNIIQLHRMLAGNAANEANFMTQLFAVIDGFGLSCSWRRRSVPVELKRQFPKTYYAHYNRDAYNCLKAAFNGGGHKDLIQLYVLLLYGFNRILRFNGRGEFNLPVGNVDFNRNAYEALHDYFAQIKTKNIEWRNEDFRSFMMSLEFRDGDFVYLDPPYLISSSEYNKYWTENEERSLLDLLNELNRSRIRFAISNVTQYRGRTNEIFQEWSRRYRSFPIRSNYISFNDNSIKDFTEVLVTNY